MIRKLLAATALAGAVLFSGCESNPARPAPGENYEYCWEALKMFSIFQENLPADPYAYNSPKELYATVGDPYTRYYDKDTAQIWMSYLNTSSGGIGIMIDSVAAGLHIRQVFTGSPGERAGLLKDDTIIAVEGIALANLTYAQRRALLGGTLGALKQLQITRGGAHPVTIPVTLGTYMAPSVFTDSLDSNIAAILITQFSDSTVDPEGTASEFNDALARTAWARYTILDLRENGGGLVDQCIDISGQFVASGTPIVNSRERYYDPYAAPDGATREKVWSTDRTVNNALTRKFYVLMDTFTASASEIVISCLRDYRTDVVSVGTRTYGKARSQYLWFPTPDSGLAKVTFSMLSPALGQPYDLVGIHPAHEIADTADALAVARDMIRQELGLPLTKRQTDAVAASDYNRLREQAVRRMIEPLAVMRIR